MDSTGVTKLDCREKKFVFLGCGAVAKAVLYYFTDLIDVNFNNVTIIDEIENTHKVPALEEIFKKGAKFMHMRLEDEKLEELFKSLEVRPNDVVVDLTTNTNSYKIIEVIRKLSLHYINTSLEIDFHYQENSTLYDESLYKRAVVTNEINKNTPDPKNATHVYQFGMNPGLISHFVLQGLLDISALALENKEDKELAEYVQKKEYAKIARHLGVEVIHCSEIDTQVSKNIRDKDVFVNTWSCIGLLEESLEPAQMGWGTHEKNLPKTGEIIGKNAAAYRVPAYLTAHQSYLPDEPIIGRVIPHGEACSLPEFLALPGYCPTVHYVYKLCPQTNAQFARMSEEELKRVTKWRVMDPQTDDLEGEDRVGALLILNKNPITGENKNWTYWSGSILGQGTSKFFGPTIVQVAAGTITAIRYTLEFPDKGPIYPEDLPVEYVMKFAKPYLGTVYSGPMSWSPESTQFTDLQVVLDDRE